jgi:hypothetical protein
VDWPGFPDVSLLGRAASIAVTDIGPPADVVERLAGILAADEPEGRAEGP